MDVELLHVQKGDKKKKITEPEKIAEFITIQIRKGTAIFLERGKKTYRVQRYDPKTDSLHVIADVHGQEKDVRAKGAKSKVTAVPPIAGG